LIETTNGRLLIVLLVTAAAISTSRG